MAAFVAAFVEGVRSDVVSGEMVLGENSEAETTAICSVVPSSFNSPMRTMLLRLRQRVVEMPDPLPAPASLTLTLSEFDDATR